nr:MAG TPA: hypothetical protein [Caudoviricetes sp.]
MSNTIYKWDGSKWVGADNAIQTYDGTRFKPVEVYKWNGQTWGVPEVKSQKQYTKTYEATWSQPYNSKGAYKVKTRVAQWGDTVSHYALWNNTTINNIVSWNDNIGNPHKIWAGRTYVVAREGLPQKSSSRFLEQGHIKAKKNETNYGNRGSMIGFDYRQMRKDLAGAEILKVEMYLRCEWTLVNKGYAIIGTHDSDSPPAGMDNRGYWYMAEEFRKGQAKWFDARKLLVEQIQKGHSKGVTLYTKKMDNEHVCAFNAGSGHTPKLRVTYRK